MLIAFDIEHKIHYYFLASCSWTTKNSDSCRYPHYHDGGKLTELGKAEDIS